MRKTVIMTACTMVATLGGAASVKAISPIDYKFMGSLTVVSGTELISVGDTFSGRFTYDADAPDTFPNDSELGWYEQGTPLGVSGFAVELGGAFSYETEQYARLVYTVQLNRQSLVDHVAIEFVDDSGAMPEFPSANYVAGSINLRAPAGTIESDATGTSLALADFPLLRHFVFDGRQQVRGSNDESIFFIEGEITSLTMVPEPTGIYWAVSSLLTAAVWRRKRK